MRDNKLYSCVEVLVSDRGVCLRSKKYITFFIEPSHGAHNVYKVVLVVLESKNMDLVQ